ncbi:nematocyst expressed protein 3-like [Scylla paramamosain]|uniref:nematocyst expressed protein 3-like n=1 Tax=Scylla paramamosain TaxID=85552 RepID=UPI003082F739
MVHIDPSAPQQGWYQHGAPLHPQEVVAPLPAPQPADAPHLAFAPNSAAPPHPAAPSQPAAAPNPVAAPCPTAASKASRRHKPPAKFCTTAGLVSAWSTTSSSRGGSLTAQGLLQLPNFIPEKLHLSSLSFPSSVRFLTSKLG